MQILSKLLINAMALASTGLLGAEAEPNSAQCARSKQLLERLLREAASVPGLSTQQLATCFGQPVASALLPSVTSGHCSSEASDLLAALIEAFGTDVAAAATPSAQPGPRYARGQPLLTVTTSLLCSGLFMSDTSNLCSGCPHNLHAGRMLRQFVSSG